MSLRGALKFLTSVRYLGERQNACSSFALGENGALLRRQLESRMREEVTRGQLVTGATVRVAAGGQHLPETVQEALNARIGRGMRDDVIFNVDLQGKKRTTNLGSVNRINCHSFSDSGQKTAADEFCFRVVEDEEGKNDVEGIGAVPANHHRYHVKSNLLFCSSGK